MLHHLSLTADDPLHVAEVLAGLIGGRITPFGPWPGGYIAVSGDGAGTAIEVYPRGTELLPDPAGQARFRHNFFAQKHTGTHAALSVSATEDEVRAVAERWDWQIQRLDRGGFEVLELWLENRVMIEILTPSMLAQYLAVVGAPRISASGAHVGTLEFSVTVPAAPDEVFRAWTDPALLRQWWGLADAKVDLRIGGSYELLFVQGTAAPARGTETCRILSYVPDRLLSFTWNLPPHLQMGAEHTWVVVAMAAAGDGCRVTLDHCGFGEGEQWSACREYFRKGWGRVLHRLRSHRGAPAVVPTQPDIIDLRTGVRAAP
jgi:uncharacterized protein YndB with AHSA1/START domain